MATMTAGWMARLAGQVRQAICGLHGHDSMLHFEQGRLSLLCSSCGYETPGWDVKNAPAVQPRTVTERRPIRMPVLTERTIA